MKIDFEAHTQTMKLERKLPLTRIRNLLILSHSPIQKGGKLSVKSHSTTRKK